MLRLTVTDAAGDYGIALVRHDETTGGAVTLAADTIPGDLDSATLPAQLRDNRPVVDGVVEFFAQNEQSPLFSAVGDWLAGLLFRGAVGPAWDSERDAGRAGLTQLDIEPPVLQTLPWELVRRDEARLFLNQQQVFVRTAARTVPTTPDLVPIRLLVVEGLADEDLGTGREISGILSTVSDFGGRLDVRMLSEPTNAELWETFDDVRPHIFHYTGHGEVNAATGQVALRLGPGWLTRDEIINSMSATPRLVVLNACRSAEELSATQSITTAFLARGAAAIVGMRGDVRGQSAATFAIKLYQALAGGATIDRATVLGRAAVFNQNANDQGRDWCLPSLTLQTDPADVLPITCGRDVTNENRGRIATELYRPVRLFVDRVLERRSLLSSVGPTDASPQPFLLIHGPNDIGKSMLVQWLQARSALRGERLRYVDLKSDTGWSVLQVLDKIRDAPEGVDDEPNRGEAYRRFDYDLRYYVLQHILPPEPDPTAPLPSARTVLPRDANAAEYMTNVFESFRGALAADAAAGPMVLVLDHVGKVASTDFIDVLHPNLIKPIAQGKVPGVRLVLVLDEQQMREYWPKTDPVRAELRVTPVLPAEFPALARQMRALRGVELDPWNEQIINGMAQSPGAAQSDAIRLLIAWKDILETLGRPGA